MTRAEVDEDDWETLRRLDDPDGDSIEIKIGQWYWLKVADGEHDVTRRRPRGETMTPDELISEYPLAAALVRRLRTIDPQYGSQLHQVDFIARAHEMQRRHPCAEAHEHSHRCYPQSVTEAVAREQPPTRK